VTTIGGPVRGLAALALVLMLGATGCITRVVRTPVFDENSVSVFLRHEERAGKPVKRGFNQPLVIAPVRITNILARIEVRKKEEKREPAIPTALLYPIGEGVARSLAQANSTQEVVVMAKERKRSMGVFTQDFLTSLIVWSQGDQLFVKLGALDEPLSKDPRNKPKEPERNEGSDKVHAVASDGITTDGAQLVSAHWRDPLFRDSGVLHVRAGGQVIRRTVLMESEPEGTLPKEQGEAGAALPPNLSPTALRALADLEEERRRGELTESDYQARRREILSGEVPAAGAPATP
jgi:hypothetical protein